MFKKKQFKLAVFTMLLCVLGGCNSSSRETQAKLEAMQKELEDTKKKMEQAQANAAEAAKDQAKQASDAAEATADAAKTTAAKAESATKNAVSKTANAAKSSSDAVAQDLAQSKKAVREELDKGKVAIADNRVRADSAQRTADEAKALAAPSPSHTIPAGTTLSVRTGDMISTKSAANGSIFEASLAEPLVIDGYTVASKGATVEGVVTNTDPGGRVKGVASIAVALRSIVMDDGRRLPVRTNSVEEVAKSSKGKDAKRVGIATGIGAAIGAIAGGGKGAAIGAGVGAGGGAGAALATRGAAAEIPAETLMTFALSAPAKFGVRGLT